MLSKLIENIIKQNNIIYIWPAIFSDFLYINIYSASYTYMNYVNKKYYIAHILKIQTYISTILGYRKTHSYTPRHTSISFPTILYLHLAS